MPTCNRALLATACGAVALGALALGGAGLAQERAESILPPGFGDPAPRPTATAAAPPRTTPAAVPTPDAAGAIVQPLPSDTPTPLPSPSASPTPVDPATLAAYEMPPFARRSLDRVGVGPAGIAADAFGRADGIYIEQLMRRMAAPLPSRWLSIALRRALVGQLDTPRHLNGADFAAERAWLLLRMGEATAARAVVQQVDNRNYTPKLYQVALNAMLAAGDPAGLCPLADGGLAVTGEGAWALARPVCIALAGNSAAARPVLAAVRRRRIATGFDLRLAEKVMGAAGGRQAVTVEWTDADRLTPWRFGLATATGVTIPDDFYAAVGPQLTGWRALSPSIPVKDRVVVAERAAEQGVLSNAALVDLYGAIAMDDDAPSSAAGTANDLRTAYSDPDVGARAGALRSLWGQTPAYGRLILTARAAVRQPAAGDNADADRIVAAMLSAGLDRTAQRWAGVVPAGGQAWALLALADPDDRRRYATSDVEGYGGGEVRQRLLFAGLAGLGRMPPAEIESGAAALGVPIGAQNSWTRALDRAVADEQPGTVLVLAGIGMQTGAWRGVPPAALYRIVAALRAVGLEGEARMIAAEAVTRA